MDITFHLPDFREASLLIMFDNLTAGYLDDVYKCSWIMFDQNGFFK